MGPSFLPFSKQLSTAVARLGLDNHPPVGLRHCTPLGTKTTCLLVKAESAHHHRGIKVEGEEETGEKETGEKETQTLHT